MAYIVFHWLRMYVSSPVAFVCSLFIDVALPLGNQFCRKISFFSSLSFILCALSLARSHSIYLYVSMCVVVARHYLVYSLLSLWWCAECLCFMSRCVFRFQCRFCAYKFRISSRKIKNYMYKTIQNATTNNRNQQQPKYTIALFASISQTNLSSFFSSFALI